MKILAALSLLAFAGCAQLATVKEIKPQKAGFEVKADNPISQLNLRLETAETAWHKLERDPKDLEARQNYNYAVARICGTLREAKLAPWAEPIKVGSRTLSWKRDPRPDWDFSRYEWVPTDQLSIHGDYVNERETREGLGAPLVAKRSADQVHEYSPTPHFFYSATAIVRFEGSRAILAIEHPLKTDTVRVGRQTIPLAADFTAPLAMMLVEMHPERLGLPRLLHPAKFADTTRIGRLEPYDPDKTVVLVVHGLMSSPATWFPLINHLRADENIRRKYQFWLFSYPSGYPYSYSAALLRQELKHVEKRFPMRKKMVVIGHSMGGCISRLLITDSGQRIWDQMFTVPPERMDLTPEHKHIITESTIFSHRPEIGRVVFISSPLQGADLAGGWIGRIGARLVQMPANLLSIGIEEARYEKVRAGHRHLERFPDSVDTLAPDNDFVKALATIPLKSGIPYHTIAGDRGRGDAPRSSDGLVPYWSSHLPGAQSEKIVPTHHNAQQHPSTYKEVARILNLHSAK